MEEIVVGRGIKCASLHMRSGLRNMVGTAMNAVTSAVTMACKNDRASKDSRKTCLASAFIAASPLMRPPTW